MGVPAFGENSLYNATTIFLQDALAGMGDYFTTDVGTLNWIEAKVQAQLAETCFNFSQLMSNQIQPASATVLLDRWANIYNLQSLGIIQNIKETIQTIQSLTGTSPTFGNVQYLMQQLLGNVFLQLQWIPENQYTATIDPYQDLVVNKQQYQMPLAKLVIYVWQPRDNADNLLLSTPIFQNLINSFIPLFNRWFPHFTEIVVMNLISVGAHQTYNTVSGTAGSNILTGVGSQFTYDFILQSGSDVVPFSINRTPPIQIVDDTNTVQTYYVTAVNSDTSLTVSTPLINNITNRTYRCLGCPMDTPGVADGLALSNN